MIKSVIFDLDGTLLDTSEGVICSVKKMIEHFGYEELTNEELETFIGPPISKSVSRIYGVSDDEALEAMKFFRKQYTMDYDGENLPDLYKGKVYPEMEHTLQKFHEIGLKVGVATYKQEWMAQSLLKEKGLYEYFDVIHGSDSNGTLTKADVVSMTIGELGHKSKETVMVGDSDNDAIGAQGAGSLFIGVTYGFGFKKHEDVEKYANIGVCNTADEILELVKNYNMMS